MSDSLGERLAKARSAKKLTMQKVADSLGIARTTYSGYESNYRVPDTETLARLASLYSVTTDYLITGREKTDDLGPAPDQNPLGIQLSDEELQVLRDMRDDPETLLMFKDFASSTEEERRMMVEIWASISKRSKKEDGKQS